MDVKLDNVFLNYKRHEMTLTMAYDFLMPSLVMLEVHILQTRNGQERTEVIMETTWQQISWLLMMLTPLHILLRQQPAPPRHPPRAQRPLQQHLIIEYSKDPPAHWYEAQLRFYGLDVSKTKFVAKMRLFDAVRSGGLVVPAHIKEIEGKMEKEWKTEGRKQSQAKKKEADIGSVNNTGGKGKGKAKRNADDIDVTVSGDSGGNFNVNVSVNFGAGKGKKGKEREKNIKAPAAKKLKTAKTDTGAKTAAAAATKKNTATKTTAKKNTATKATATTTTTTNPTSSSASTSRRGGTTRRGRGGLANVTSSGGRAASAAGSSPPPPPRRPIPRQTARRSRPFPYPGRTIGPGPSTTSNNSSYPDPPPPYSTSQDNYYYNSDGNTNYSDDNNSYSDDDDNDDNNDDNNSYYSRTPSPSLGPPGLLGLLNGRYSFESPALRDWAMYDDHPFILILTLHQNALWSAYDFGMFTSILHIPQRPWEASADKQYEFSWCGKENSQGVISYDDARQKGWVRFLGNGRIDGVIEVYGKARLSGVRVSGEQTRSERDAASMRAEWEGYSQEAYEHARVARWR
ncbi:hypothetical protein GX50_03372 [[Emmonsia] crescens]|uniref:Uncharacterized protein n=1 Tax=[Emmonsia] crescens TaxID=73230 RepID=A0A2B7ZKU5_9EURO|nr:hypothetical protein GX50_03372 [Emmonsia crescens]